MQAPGMAYRPPSAGTAQTMLLIGLIFQIIFAAVFLFGVGLVGILAASAVGLGFTFLIVPLIFLVLFGIIPLFFLYVGYEWCYKRVRNGDYEGARTPTLILAIIELIFGGVLPGIFYLIGYIKLGDAVNESRQPQGYAPGYMPGQPMPGYGAPAPGYAAQPPAQPYQAPAGSAPPMAAAPAAAPAAAQAPVCPRCGRPATWVPQYSRYYCYTDAQYI